MKSKALQIRLVRSLQNVMSLSPEGKKEEWREIMGCEILYPADTFSEGETLLATG